MAGHRQARRHSAVGRLAVAKTVAVSYERIRVYLRYRTGPQLHRRVLIEYGATSTAMAQMAPKCRKKSGQQDDEETDRIFFPVHATIAPRRTPLAAPLSLSLLFSTLSARSFSPYELMETTRYARVAPRSSISTSSTYIEASPRIPK